MSKLTKEQKRIEIIKYNIELCHAIILKAECVNKGRYAHDINKFLGILKDEVKRLEKRKVDSITMKELTDSTKTRMVLSERLYFLSQGL